MSSKARRPEEEAAEQILVGILGGRGADRDENQSSRLFDFHIQDLQGVPRHAVEVTSANDEDLRRAGARRKKISIKDVKLTRTWICSLHEGAETIAVSKDAPPLLNMLTAAGVERFDASLELSDDPVVEALGQLGLDDGRSEVADEPRLMLVGWGGGRMDPLDITEAVEEELFKDDNLRKEGAQPGETRHLFVWLDGSRWSAFSQMFDLLDPQRPLPPAPLLPPQFDVVWVAVSERDWEPVVLLRADADGLVRVDAATGAVEPARASSYTACSAFSVGSRGANGAR